MQSVTTEKYVPLDVARLIMQDIESFSPIELILIARISKSFHRVIKDSISDYGIRKNLIKVLNFVYMCNNCMRHVDKGKFIDDIIQDGFFFGSTLLCALVTKINGKIAFKPSDVDIFFPVSKTTKSNQLYDCVKSLKRSRTSKYFKNPLKQSSHYDMHLDCFAVFRTSMRDTDMVIGLRGGRSRMKSTWNNICRSEILMNRSIYGKTGLLTESVESFFHCQTVPFPEHLVDESSTRKMEKFVHHLLKFAHRDVQDIELELPIQHSCYTLKILTRIREGDKIEYTIENPKLGMLLIKIKRK